MVSEIFLSCSHNKSRGAIDPKSAASFDPRDLIGRVYAHGGGGGGGVL